jgi:hypothetical protein
MPAIAEKYVACKNVTFTLDSVAMIVLDGGFTFNQSIDDFTSNVSEGHYEDIATNDKHDFNLTLAYDGDSPPTWVEGSKYNFVLNGNAQWIADGGIYRSGVMRVESCDWNPFNVKEGLRIKMKGTSQGAVVRVRP